MQSVVQSAQVHILGSLHRYRFSVENSVMFQKVGEMLGAIECESDTHEGLSRRNSAKPAGRHTDLLELMGTTLRGCSLGNFPPLFCSQHALEHVEHLSSAARDSPAGATAAMTASPGQQLDGVERLVADVVAEEVPAVQQVNQLPFCRLRIADASQQL